MSYARRVIACLIATLLSGSSLVGLFYALTCHARAAPGLAGYAIMFGMMFCTTAVYAILPTLIYSIVIAGGIVKETPQPSQEWTRGIAVIVLSSTAVQMVIGIPIADTILITGLAIAAGSLGIVRLQRIRARELRQRRDYEFELKR